MKIPGHAAYCAPGWVGYTMKHMPSMVGQTSGVPGGGQMPQGEGTAKSPLPLIATPRQGLLSSSPFFLSGGGRPLESVLRAGEAVHGLSGPQNTSGAGRQQVCGGTAPPS